MSLNNYLAKSDAPYAEILYAFSQEEIEQLYNLLRISGFEKHIYFVRENIQDILKYISLSESQRKQKKWINHPQNLSLRFAALQISSATVEFLRQAHPIAYIVDSGSYRQFHSAVANALTDFLLYHPLAVFPFENHKNPFLKK